MPIVCCESKTLCLYSKTELVSYGRSHHSVFNDNRRFRWSSLCQNVAYRRALYISQMPFNTSTNAKRRGRSLTQNRRLQYSHPITTTLVVSAHTSFNWLTAALLDGSRFALLRGLLGSWSSSRCCSVASSTSWLLFIVLSWLLTGSCCNGLSVLLVLVHGPVEDIIVLEALTDEEITEDLAKVGIVWLVVESKGSGVVEIDGEFVGEPSAKNLSWGGHLLFHDSVVLLLFGSGLQSLPWKGTSAKVEHDISKRFHVITARLLDTKMSVD